MEWNWSIAGYEDVDGIMSISREHFKWEASSVFPIDETRFRKHLLVTMVEQAHNLLSVQLIVARHEGVIIAYSWLTRGNWMTYSNSEVGEVLFAHVNLDLSPRVRVKLLREMITQWELWCKICSIPVLVSSTIRSDQGAFLKIHQKMGFDVRGSFAFKKII